MSTEHPPPGAAPRRYRPSRKPWRAPRRATRAIQPVAPGLLAAGAGRARVDGHATVPLLDQPGHFGAGELIQHIRVGGMNPGRPCQRVLDVADSRTPAAGARGAGCGSAPPPRHCWWHLPARFHPGRRATPAVPVGSLRAGGGCDGPSEAPCLPVPWDPRRAPAGGAPSRPGRRGCAPARRSGLRRRPSA